MYIKFSLRNIYIDILSEIMETICNYLKEYKIKAHEADIIFANML